jgi:GH35 family endo-1,4-beta-xylanase
MLMLVSRNYRASCALLTILCAGPWGTGCVQAQQVTQNITPPTGNASVATTVGVPTGQLTPQTMPLPAGGTAIIEIANISRFTLAGDARQDAQVRVVPVQGQTFNQAWNIKTMRTPGSPWLIQLVCDVAMPIKKGDVMLATFWLRGLETDTGEAFAALVFEEKNEPFTKSASYETSAGAQWQQYYVAFEAAGDYAPGEAAVNLRVGYGPQTIELGGVSLVNYGKEVKLEDLPASPTTYAGRSLDSAWRKAAQARIEKLRKADLKMRVTDRAGKAVEGVQVAVRMKKHTFAFGAAVSASALVPETPENAIYRAKVKELFNEVVLENDLKWRQWEENRERALQAVRWLKNNDIRLRGHTLVWPSWRKSPSQVKAFENDREGLRALIDNHIRDEVTATRGDIHDWDVLNEVYKNHDIVDILGELAMVEWFKTSRAHDNKPTLYINDYGILAGGGTDRAHQDAYEKTIRYLIDNGAPIGGIGFQGHFGSRLTPPEKLLQILDRFALLGKRLKVTEFDVLVRDEALQADYTRDFLTVLFSHPAVDGVVMWGFWEGRHYAPQAALWRKDWSLKPNGKVWTDLVLNQWHTRADGKTGARGEYTVRGFLGNYEISLTHGGKTKTVPMTLAADANELTVMMP